MPLPVTPNLGLQVPQGGSTPGAANNTTVDTYPNAISVDLYLIDSLVYSAANPPPPVIGVGLAPPTTGTYILGNILWNSNPMPGGIVGWVCTTAGTPGVWKAFGPITT
jgi:hypothetical protein